MKRDTWTSEIFKKLWNVMIACGISIVFLMFMLSHFSFTMDKKIFNAVYILQTWKQMPFTIFSFFFK